MSILLTIKIEKVLTPKAQTRGRVPKHIKNKEAITFFLLNENAPNFVRAEGMGRK